MSDIRDTIARYFRKYDPLKGFQALLFRAGDYLGAHQLNDAFELERDRSRAVADVLLQNGRITSGGTIVLGQPVDGVVRVTLEAGDIYINGAIHRIPAAGMDIPASGSVIIGVRLTSDIVMPEEDASLKGVASGTRAEGELMAPALRMLARWGRSDDGGEGDFYPVYEISDGSLVTTDPTPVSDAYLDTIRRYDREAHGHYVVEGMGVRALGLDDAGRQVFSVAEGTVNVNGYKISRSTSYRLPVPEEPDIEAIDNEPHVLQGEAPHTITLRYGPIHQIREVALTRQRTVTMTHGAYNGASDSLPDATVAEVVEVRQGATVYKAGTDYLLTGAAIDWSPSGAEPAPGSSYQVTYRYVATIQPLSSTATTITVTDGVPGSIANVSYRYKMPRFDAIAVRNDGSVVYVRGISSRLSPQKAYVGGPQIKLADVWNVWGAKPLIEQVGTVKLTFRQQRALEKRLADLEVMVAEERLKSDISNRNPVTKRGLFADPLLDDTFRDQGIAQTGAVFGGSLQLPIDVAIVELAAPQLTLPGIDEIIIEQPFHTDAMLINPYQAFPPPVPAVQLSPAVDIWSETETIWTSDVTYRFYEFVSYYWDPNPGSGPGGHGWSTSTTTSSGSEKMGSRTETIEFIRQRPVSFTLTNFGPGEELKEILFDGIPVTPQG